MVRDNKTLVVILTTLTIGAISSAAKAIVDVAVLKSEIKIYVEDTREIKLDIREIRNKIDKALDTI